MKKSIIYKALATFMLVAIITMVYCPNGTEYAEAAEVYSFEDLDVPYDGAWIEFTEGFQLYLPSDWETLEITDEMADEYTVFVSIPSDDASGYVVIQQLTVEDLGGEISMDYMYNYVASNSNFANVEEIVVNGLAAVSYDSLIDEEGLSGLWILDNEGGCYIIMCGPTYDEDFLLTASTILLSLSSTSSTETSSNELLFHDIPWGTSFAEVNDILSNLELIKYTDAAYVTYTADYLTLGTYSAYTEKQFDNNGIKINASAKNREYFAGYAPSEEGLFFSYTVNENGRLPKTDEASALYGAIYVFKPASYLKYTMKQDLIDELISLYGEADEAYSSSIYEYMFWYGDNDTEIVFRIEDTSNGCASDKLCIIYAWKGGDDLLQAASDALG